MNNIEENKFFVICNYRFDNQNYSSNVKNNEGKVFFDTYQEANELLEYDMNQYMKAEREAGRDCKIVSNHIEWIDPIFENEYQAEWYIYNT